MPRVFLSHSSRDNRQAMALKAWLESAEPGLAGEIFLDLDPGTGIAAGTRWKEALRQASDRCEAVICLLSEAWDASHECKTEYRTAEDKGKPIFPVRLVPCTGRDITSEWQRCELFGDGPKTAISVDGESQPVQFLTEGLLRLRDGLRKAGIAPDSFSWPPAHEPDRAPYRGWQPLEEADAAVYFGRDAQISRALTAIRGLRSSGEAKLFVILGPSGTGKSSFLRAGLLPRLRRDDRHFLPMGILRPQRHPLTGDNGLAAAIHALRLSVGMDTPRLGAIKVGVRDPERVRGWLIEAQRAAADRLVDAAGAPPPTIVLPIDQAEELFVADADAECPQLLALLAGLLGDGAVTLPMIVALTVRSDRYEPLQTAPQLAGIGTRVFDDLKPMPPAQFREVICGPAARAHQAGARIVWAPELVERLLQDCGRGADTLPLLALTLARLYRDFGDGQVGLAEYESMGGMARVVQTEVDNLLATDPAQRQAQLELLHDAFIPWLATINPDNDQPMRRVARFHDLPAASHPLIDRFVEKRLLVKDIRDGQVIIEVALESLLRQWRELATWLRAESHDLKHADTLERAAADWQASGRNEAWLLEGTRLAEAETLTAKPGFRDRLDPTRDFLHASRQRKNDRIEAELQAAREKQETAEAHAATLRKRSRILRVVLAVTLVIAAVAGLLFVRATIAERRADARAREAIALRLTSQGESRLAGVQGGGDVRAFKQILAAQHIASTADAGALLTAAVKRRHTLKIIETPAAVNDVAFSPDGTRIASGGWDNTVRMWDAATGQPVGQTMTGHQDGVWGVAFSPDGTRIASGGWDNTVRVWDAATGQPVGQPLTGHTQAVESVAFSPDGTRIVSGGDDTTVRVWDAHTGEPIGPPLTGHQNTVFSVAFSPDGTRIVSGSEDATIRVWDPDTGKQIGQPMTGHTGLVYSVAFSPDGTRIASGGADRTVRLWDAHTGQPVGPPLTGHQNTVFSVAFSPDGQRIVSGGGDNTVRVWDAATGQPVGQPMTGHTNGVFSVAFSPDGTRIASGSYDMTVRLWDVDVGQPMTGHTDAVASVAFSPDGTRIVSVGVDTTVRVWDADTGQPVGQPLTVTEALGSVALSPDGKRIASGGTDNTVRVWDAATGQPVGQPLTGQTGLVTSVAFSPDGQRIASGGADTTVRVWDADTGQPVGQPLTGHTGLVTSVAFSPDGKRIASGGDDYTVRLWDADRGQPIGQPLTGHRIPVFSVAFSPDGQRIASGSLDSAIRLWDTDTGQPIGQPLTGHTGLVTSVAFSPDGTRIVSGGWDATVRVWDVDTGQPIGQPLTGHTGPVSRVAFSPDGTHIASGSADNTVRVWPGYADTAAVCAKLTTNLSHQQWRDWVSPDIDYVEVCPRLPIPPDG